MRIQMITIAKGAFSGRSSAGRIVCLKDAAWRDIWAEHTGGEMTAPLRLDMDFSNEAVLAVFAGQRPSSGWTVAIIATEVAGATSPGSARDQGTLKVCYTVRAPLGAAQDVQTSPFHIVRVPRNGWERAVFELVDS